MDPEILFEMSAASLEGLTPINEIYNLEGKVAVVAGTAGLALHVINRLAECGAKVAFGGRKEVWGHSAVETLQGLGRTDVAFKQTDIRNVEDCRALVTFAEETFGPVDIVVPVAATWQARSFLDMSEELWDDIVDTDLKGQYFLVQAAVRSMVAAKHGGKVVTIASPAYRGEDQAKLAMMTPYNASKAGVIGATLGIARELRQYGINVNCVVPGGMVTPGAIMNNVETTKLYGKEWEKDQMSSGGETPVASTPDEVALMIVTMCTQVSDYMYGALVEVTGGAGLSYQAKPWSYTMGEGFLSANS